VLQPRGWLVPREAAEWRHNFFESKAMPNTNVSRRRSATGLPPHPGLIFVKFRDSVELPYVDGVEQYLAARNPQQWEAITRIAPSATFKRVYTLPPNQIKALIAKARQVNDRYKAPPWDKRFALHFKETGVETALVKKLLSWKEVEQAYVAPRLAAPALTGTNPLSSSQWYLQMAPVGIDGDYTARNVPGGAAEGQDVIDLEAGWVLDHPDLISQNIPAPLVGTNLMDNVWRPHGTRVLGVVCAADNNLGVVGIAPHVRSIRVVSHSNDENQFHQAMLVAVATLAPRSVLLLETSLTWTPGGPDLPFETDQWMFADIKDAVQNSELVVVEPAGNGKQNLDTYWVDQSKASILDRDRPARDSGAIIVGAANNYNRQASWPANPNFVWRRVDANYGRRIDCFAWGESVYTTDPFAAQATVPYSTNFGGTSSASAIVAGAALVVQGMAEGNLGSRLLPAAVRKLLSDARPATATDPFVNTPSNSPAVDQIGVMPNLKAIATWLLNPTEPPPQPPPQPPPAPKRRKRRKRKHR
jgi:Subtilase family